MAIKNKLEKLLQQKNKIDKKIAKLQAEHKKQLRKDDTRLKVLVGAALLADAKINIETAVIIEEVLHRAVSSQRDRIFLQSKGWLIRAKNADADSADANKEKTRGQ